LVDETTSRSLLAQSVDETDHACRVDYTVDETALVDETIPHIPHTSVDETDMPLVRRVLAARGTPWVDETHGFGRVVCAVRLHRGVTG